VLSPARADVGAISPDLAAVPGRQMQQAGSAMTNLGVQALDVVNRLQQDVNQVRVSDALNKARQRAIDLTYDPQGGFLSLKGDSALERPNGVSLSDEYGQKLQESISEISNGLGNDAQRQAFSLRAADLSASFGADIQKHTLSEYKSFSLSVQDGAIKLSTDEAQRNWSDPVKIDTALSDVKAAVVRAGQLQGESANETLSKMKIATSRVHTGVISAALENSNASYASQYLQKYKDDMTADDILKVNGVLTRHLDSRIAQEAVRITGDKFASKFQPTDQDRLVSVVESIESNGQDFGKDGAPLKSVKGAKYRMQVMPDTAKAPGFGIKPAADDSAAEFNRVGREYLAKLVEKYGNVPQALAAYNAGPGAVDKALEKAKKSQALAKGDPSVKVMDWLAYIPAETRDYVRKGVDKFTAGAGPAPMPTELEFVQNAVSLLGSNPRPEQVKLTREAAEHQYNLISKSVKQRGEEAVAVAMKSIIQNGGRFFDLPEAMRSAIPPKEVDNLINFAQKISKGDDSTSPWLYNKLTSNPDALARMSDNEFFALRRELSEGDFKHFSNERAKLTGKVPGSNGPGELNSTAIKQTLDERLRMLQIDPTPKDDGGADAARIGAIRRFVDQYFMAAQRDAGKKFSDTEVSQHLDSLFAKNVTFRGMFSNSSGPMLTMKVGDIESSVKDNIKAAFKRQGIDSPTDAQILNAYWNMKATRK
jgi:soluble lytic murein transglycosylase